MQSRTECQDEKIQFLEGPWPVQGIIWILRRLGSQNNMGIFTGAMFQQSCHRFGMCSFLVQQDSARNMS